MSTPKPKLQRRTPPPPLPPKEQKTSKLQRRSFTKIDIPKLLHHEMKDLSEEVREAISPTLMDMFAITSHPLVVEAEHMARIGLTDEAISAAWDLNPTEFTTLRIEFPDLDTAIRRGRSHYTIEQHELANDPYAGNVNAEDLATLDTTKLKDEMFKGIYVLEAALFGQAGFEHQRIQKLRKTLTTLEADLLSPEALHDLSKDEKMELYVLGNKTMQKSLGFLGKLHDSVADGLEAVANVERHKQQKSAPVIQDPTEKDNLDEVRSVILAEIKKRATK